MADTTLESRTIAPPEPTPKAWFRGDVDGLRAVAIVLVVAYHAGLQPFHGGFIGVDVFFVISGFLISRRLLSELQSTRRISLPTFWARRIRRLVPALALVVVVTFAFAFVIMPAFSRAELAKQGGSAALYVSNILFAIQAQNYFTADVQSSPFLHTWSLGVEEQFYLVWPVLFALVGGLAARSAVARRRLSRRRTLVGIFGGIFLVSFAFDVWLTQTGSTWAFFSLPTRAWEFAVAGVIAALPLPAVLRGVGSRLALAIAGIGILAIALLLIDTTTPYPGSWAMLPVAAAVVLIVAGDTSDGRESATSVHRMLATAPMQWLGRVSYSWYLWHWPAIVLATAWLESDSRRVKVGAALLSLPVAAAAYHFYETPVRFSPRIRSNPRTYAFGLAVTLVVLAVAVGVWARAPKVDLASVGGSADPAAGSALDLTQGPPGASLQDRVNFVNAQYQQQVENDCPRHSVKTADGDDYCVGGDQSSTRSVMLLGDSHAGQWRAVMDDLAREKHLKLLVRQHDGCPPYPVPVIDNGLAQHSIVCRNIAAGDVRVVNALKPEAVVLAVWSGSPATIADPAGNVASPEDQTRLWRDGVRTMLTGLQQDGVKVGFVVDEPTFPTNVSQCLSTRNSVAACNVGRATGLKIGDQLIDVERSVLDELHIPRVDLTDAVCDATTCYVERDGVLVYVDRHHVTAAFAAKQRPKFEQLFGQLLP